MSKFQIVNAHWLEYCKKVVCQRSQGSHLTDISRLLKHTKEEPFNRDDDENDGEGKQHLMGCQTLKTAPPFLWHHHNYTGCFRITLAPKRLMLKLATGGALVSAGSITKYNFK